MNLIFRALAAGIAVFALLGLSLARAQDFERFPISNGAEKIRMTEDSGHAVHSKSNEAIPTGQPLRIRNLLGNLDDHSARPIDVEPSAVQTRSVQPDQPLAADLQVNVRENRQSIELVDHDLPVFDGQSQILGSETGTADAGALDIRLGDYFDQSDSGTLQLQTSMVLPGVEPIFVSPANQNSQGQEMLAPFLARVNHYRLSETSSGVPELQSLPQGFAPWWMHLVGGAAVPGNNRLSISLDELLQTALQHSPHVQLAAAEPHIRQTVVFEEAAQFDWRSFLATRYDDTNDPVGNELTTGNNSNRFTQQEWHARGGLRRRNIQGGEVEIAQRLGYLDNNSRFLIPPDQGNSRLELNYRQPLLKGRGQAVNESLIVLADIDFQAASDDFLEALQSHLTDVTETYWELVRARSEYFQRQKLLSSAEQVLENLQGRSEVDALDRQVFRAKAAVANRRAEIARSLTSIKNAESRLRLLVNEPSLINAFGSELTPIDLPSIEHLPINLADALSTALTNRPDISRAIRELRASHVRLGVTRNDVLPQLDFLLGTYVAGLDGDSDINNAWINQFRDGRPGFNFGLEYELPVGNRAAHAAQQRRQWELTRSLHQFRAVVEMGLNEVEIAVREVETSHREMTGRYHAMVAAANESEFLIDRWQTLPGIDDSVTLLLEDLLDSQERLADEEAGFARAQFDYAVAIVSLKQAMGTLFTVQPGG